ncbi:MAG: hypothetical protein KAI84_06710 [Gammaproteobacteria bacterium]|nr:hypothetical protein [Gammaproteobacteria bacterium]
MDIELYFPFDKIVAFGSIEIKGEKPSYIRDLLDKYLDKVVIRRGCGGFSISLNRNIEAKILKIMASDVKNKRQRIYQLLDTREPDAIDKVIERLSNTATDSTGVGAGVTRIWLEISAHGHYCEETDKNDFALDWMVFKGLLEYDDYGYYSISEPFIARSQKHSELSIGKIKKLGLPSDDLKEIINILELMGYSFNQESMKFIMYDAIETTNIALVDGFMCGTE